MDGTGESPIIDYFVQRDPSGNNKYLEWMVKAILHKPTLQTIGEMISNDEWKEGIWGEMAGYIANLVERFHRLTPYLVHTEDGVKQGTTDLYQYKFTDSDMINYLIFDLDRAEERYKTKKVEKEADKLVSDSNWFVVRPKTWESSCHYGAGTK